MKITRRLRIRLPFFAGLACLVFESALGHTDYTHSNDCAALTVPASLTGESIVLPTGFSDPIEPFNRAIWGFNKGFMTSVVRPASKVYRRVVFKPVRTGIGKIMKNLTYPNRLLNNMFQGNWNGMVKKRGRCLCNTVLGLGGFFDVATRLGIPKNEADFGQTFRKWGWKPGFYLMLPVFGPSDKRDAVGLVGDTAANPMTYFFPYKLISSAGTANNLTDSVEGFVRFSRSEADSYSILQYAWSFEHENRKVDMCVTGNQDEASLETLESVLSTFKSAVFPAQEVRRDRFRSPPPGRN